MEYLKVMRRKMFLKNRATFPDYKKTFFNSGKISGKILSHPELNKNNWQFNLSTTIQKNPGYLNAAHL